MDVETLDLKWEKVQEFLKKRFGKAMDIKSILFVLGLNELQKKKDDYTKEEKMDLMNIGFCKIASISGYFQETGKDADGWPKWEQRKAVPKMGTKEQEAFIKEHIILHFEEEALI